jgi:dephospho-CoA kinase
MIVLGLTGCIAMGKTTAAAMFRREGVPVYDADRVVHRLLAKGGKAVPEVEAAFPGVVRNGGVDREALARRVFGNDAALKRLEGILHPRVRRAREHFLAVNARHRRPLVVLDIPLLYETGGNHDCDVVAVVSAPAFVQYQRLGRRRGMTRDRALAIAARQMADAEKRRRADFVIPTGLGRAVTARAVRAIVQGLRAADACRRSGAAAAAPPAD